MIRLGSATITVAAVYLTLFSGLLPQNYGAYLLFLTINSILFSHYLMSFVATRKTAWRLLQSQRGRLVMGAIFVGILWSNWYEAELGYVFFGIHFAFSETYSRFLLDGERRFYSSRDHLMRRFRALHLIFMLTLYFYGTAHTFEYITKLAFVSDGLPAGFFATAMIATGLLYAGFLYRNHAKLFPEQTAASKCLAYALPELALVSLAVLCHVLRVHWSLFVGYHILFWLVTPLFVAKSHSWKNQLNYWIPTLVCITMAFILFPSSKGGGVFISPSYVYTLDHPAFTGFDPSIMNDRVMEAFRWSLVVGNFHILFSLALSTLNPRIIRQTAAQNGEDPLGLLPAVS